MGATAALALQGTAMQDVLKLLLEVQAAHAPVVPRPAHTASASTSAAKGRVLRLKLAGKAPAQQAAEALPAAAGQAQAAALGTSAQERHSQAAPAVAAAGATTAVSPAQSTGRPSKEEAQAGSTAAAKALQAPIAAVLPGSVSTAAAPQKQQAAAAAAQQGAAPAQQQKAVSPKVVCEVLSTLMKLTQRQPQGMVQEMVRSPGYLNMFLQLMGPSTQYAKCQLYAADIVTTCLCWASVPDK
jgi:hypothetical protein